MIDRRCIIVFLELGPLKWGWAVQEAREIIIEATRSLASLTDRLPQLRAIFFADRQKISQPWLF